MLVETVPPKFLREGEFAIVGFQEMGYITATARLILQFRVEFELDSKFFYTFECIVNLKSAST